MLFVREFGSTKLLVSLGELGFESLIDVSLMKPLWNYPFHLFKNNNFNIVTMVTSQFPLTFKQSNICHTHNLDFNEIHSLLSLSDYFHPRTWLILRFLNSLPLCYIKWRAFMPLLLRTSARFFHREKAILLLITVVLPFSTLHVIHCVIAPRQQFSLKFSVASPLRIVYELE